MKTRPRILLPARPGAAEWLLLRNPVEVLVATSHDEVRPCLRQMEAGVAAGLQAAGFVSYEAAPGLDRAFAVQPLSGFPLVYFALFERAEPFVLPAGHADPSAGSNAWRPDTSREEYLDAIAEIKARLRRGETYQVNYSMRLRADFRQDPFDFFLRMHAAQRAAYSVYLETDEFVLCSASPELFFELRGTHLVARPMKGTARRGMTAEQDLAVARELFHSEKNRAENVMIVDMVRNDMGRIAEVGSVDVTRLYEVEKYPTVWQMTSTVECRTRVSVGDLFGALFPCASITGAPKVRTMEVIRDLERSSRGVYCGSIGHVAPGRNAWFNVAIRTLTVRPGEKTAEYGVGGGIVWDSEADAEYRECVAKAAVLGAAYPEFELIETLLWEGSKGYFLAEAHLARLAASARYFDFVLNGAAIQDELARVGSRQGAGRSKVRLLLRRDGRFHVESTPLPPLPRTEPRPWILEIAGDPIDVDNPFVYHKTTFHPVRGRDLASLRGAGAGRGEAPDDLLLWNARGEVTESSLANLVMVAGGRKWTPPVRCGLLAGVFRGWLLGAGEIEEAVLTVDDVRQAEAVYLINSVRKWIPARLMGAPDE